VPPPHEPCRPRTRRAAVARAVPPPHGLCRGRTSRAGVQPSLASLGARAPA